MTRGRIWEFQVSQCKPSAIYAVVPKLPAFFISSVRLCLFHKPVNSQKTIFKIVENYLHTLYNDKDQNFPA